jgi:hypothetical protein
MNINVADAAILRNSWNGLTQTEGMNARNAAVIK